MELDLNIHTKRAALWFYYNAKALDLTSARPVRMDLQADNLFIKNQNIAVYVRIQLNIMIDIR